MRRTPALQLTNLSDDIMLLIIIELMRLTPRDAVSCGKASVQTVGALARSCTQFRALIRERIGVLLEELQARQTTCVPPRIVCGQTSFIEQRDEEARSARHIKLLRESTTSMAIHCASRCCANRRRAVNKTLRRKDPSCVQDAGILPVSDHVHVLGANANGDSAYLVSRRRCVPGELAGMHGELVLCKYQGNQLVSDITLMEHESAPHMLSCSQGGDSCAVLSGVHSFAANTPFSEVRVWTCGEPKLSNAVKAPLDIAEAGCVHPQSVWWANTPQGERLVVLWSTRYIHPLGSLVGEANANLFGFAVYAPPLEPLDGAVWELQISTGYLHGAVCAASPREDGTQVVLTQLKPCRNRTFTTLYEPLNETSVHSKHSIKHSSSLPQPNHPRSPGPFSAAISPRGDCILAAHAVGHRFYIELLLRDNVGSFCTVCSADATHYVLETVHEMEDEDEEEANLAPFRLGWSPCGRYAILVNQRSVYTNYEAHSILMVDTVSRNCGGRGIRVMPLCVGGSQSPRGITWTAGGFWVHSKHGALLLRA